MKKKAAQLDTKPVTPRLLTPAAAAAYIAMTESFLEKDRAGARAVAFIKIASNCVRYEQSALDAFVDERRKGGAATAPARKSRAA